MKHPLIVSLALTTFFPLSHTFTFVPNHRLSTTPSLHTAKLTTTKSRLFASSIDDKDDNTPWWREEGDAIIRAAAIEAGADGNMLKLDWGPGYLTVTVGGEACLSTTPVEGEEEDEEGIEYDDEDDDIVMQDEEEEVDDEEYDEDDEVDDDSDEGEEEKEEKPTGPDIAAIARAINKALDGEEGTIGWTIATTHSIDVTTPGVLDELSGLPPKIIESYKGFDVIVEAFDKKKDKNVIFEGKLVDRVDNVTTINLKGRKKKLKNELISSIRLPKAKREKGV